MSYCEKCGAEEVSELTGAFNKENGEKMYRYVCQKNPCGHSGHVLGHYGEFSSDATFWMRFFHDSQCKRCKCGVSY